MDTPRGSSPPPSSAGDTIDEDSKPKIAEDVDDQSIAESSIVTPNAKKPRKRKPAASKRRGPSLLNESALEATEDEGSMIETKLEGTPDPQSKSKDTPTAKGQNNGATVGSVYSGTKIKHIKKEDGTPLWRKEIQYEFLRLVIEDTTPCFTRFSDGKKECNFADIYIDCLIHSSKTSQILKGRLRGDRQAGQNMAMICLLVNVGRMNTTLNFFPEMRAQLRTYHSIPSLQAYPTQKDYKSLQDAPRLKSILKGASEDENHPRSVYAMEQSLPPRGNAVNAIFILSTFASRVSEEHFVDKVDFFDLMMRPTITSKSRARAFLWLMYWYLESPWKKAEALANPFGPGQYHPDDNPEDPTVMATIVPELEYITEEQADAENVDPEVEIEFGEKMSRERKKILEQVANEPPLTMADPGNPEVKSVKRLKGGRKSQPALIDEDSTVMSDNDSRASPGLGRSPAPLESVTAMNSALGAQADSLDNDFESHDPHPGRGRYKRVRGKNTPSRAKTGTAPATAPSASNKRRLGTPDVRSTPQPVPGGTVIMSQYGVPKPDPANGVASIPPKPRARTGYQRELEQHKQKRIEWALRQKRKRMITESAVYNTRTRLILSTARRVQELEATYDSEEEETPPVSSTALGGLTTRVYFGPADDRRMHSRHYDREDWGAEAERLLRATKRIRRRMNVWDGERDLSIRHRSTSKGLRGKGAVPDELDDGVAARDKSARSAPRTKKEMDAQIEEDLLAERSDNDEEMGDENTPLNDDGDGMEADGEDGDSDVAMD